MSAAHFSPDRVYRYWLTREVDPLTGHGSVCFVMLNPSTATAEEDDPTIRRVVGYAKRWGYHTLCVVNLFAFRSTDPKALLRADDPIGPDNDEHIRVQATLADRVVLGWGAHGHLHDRADRVLEILRFVGVWPYCLTRTNGGQPGHPLYIRRDVVPMEYLRRF